ncbi:MAG: hypothetical protein LC798_13485 [Chloroflexi bacterium]|nr:hypothetical protein [Chloroflexota bacterium]
MASSATHTLLPVATYGGAVTGDAFATGGRTAWRLTVQTAALSAPFDVVVEARAGNGDWREVGRANVTVVGSSILTTEDNPAFDVQPFDTAVRVRIEPTGTYTAGVVATAPFFDAGPSVDLFLLTKRLREYDDGLPRLIDEAEDDVLSLPQLRRTLAGQVPGLDMSDPRFLGQMKLAIARQAERRYQLDRLRASSDDDALGELTALSVVAPEVESILGPFVVHESGEEPASEFAGLRSLR